MAMVTGYSARLVRSLTGPLAGMCMVAGSPLLIVLAPGTKHRFQTTDQRGEPHAEQDQDEHEHGGRIVLVAVLDDDAAQACYGGEELDGDHADDGPAYAEP